MGQHQQRIIFMASPDTWHTWQKWAGQVNTISPVPPLAMLRSSLRPTTGSPQPDCWVLTQEWETVLGWVVLNN